jgi:tetratricopeptide (TPR) repeat protein
MADRAAMDPAAVTRRVEVLCQLDRAEEAVPLLELALAENPDSADLWRHLAYVQAQLDQPSAALEATGRSLEIEPDEEWAHRLASLALDKLGRHADAIAAAQQATRLDPDNWRAHVRLALALLAAGGRHREAWAVATHAAELAPHEPEVHNTVGAMALAVDDYTQAENAFRHVLELDPDNAKAIHNLALVERARGRLGQAAARFGDAVASDPRMHDSAMAVDDSLLELLRRTVWFTATLTGVLVVLGLVGRGVQSVAYGVFALLLGVTAWSAYSQVPPYLRPHLRRLARRYPMVVVSACLWLVAVAAVAVWAVAVWFAGSPWSIYWVLIPTLGVALPLTAWEAHRLRDRIRGD